MWYKELKSVHFEKYGKLITSNSDLLHIRQYKSETVVAKEADKNIFFQFNYPTYLEPEQGIGILIIFNGSNDYELFLFARPIEILSGVWYAIAPFECHFSYYIYTKGQSNKKYIKFNMQFNYTPQIEIEKLFTFSYQEKSNKFVFKGEKHPFWELIYVDMGNLNYRVENKDNILSQGELYFCQPNRFHSLFTTNKKMVSFINISYKLKLPLSYYKYFDNKIIVTQKQKLIFQAILNEYFENDTLSNELIMSYIHQIILDIIRNFERLVEAKSIQSEFLIKINNCTVKNAMDLINNNIKQKYISVGWIAKKLSISTSYLLRVFRQSTGDNVSNYIRSKRMLLAKQMISEGNTSITGIAMELGFCTQSYFSTQFKKEFGITPREYSRKVYRA